MPSTHAENEDLSQKAFDRTSVEPRPNENSISTASQLEDPFKDLSLDRETLLREIEKASYPEPLHQEFGTPLILAEDMGEKFLEKFNERALTHDTALFSEILKLHKAVDRSVTMLGSAALLRDMLEPPVDPAIVLARRESILELESNSSFRDSIKEFLTKIKLPFFRDTDAEKLALRLFAPDVSDRADEGISFWKQIRRELQCIFNPKRGIFKSIAANGYLLSEAKKLPPAESSYLKHIFSKFEAARLDDDGALLDGDVLRSPFGIHSPGKAKWYMPAFRGTANFISVEDLLLHPLTTIGMLTIFSNWYVNSTSTVYASPTQKGFVSVGVAGLALLSMIRGHVFSSHLFKPLREKLLKNNNLMGAIDAIGELDMLLSLAELPQRLGENGSYPKLIDSDRYYFEASEMHNPTLVLNGYSVPNGVSVKGGELNAITGPNSGGKTTLCTGVTQNQILGQLGSAIAARNATMSIADNILYQAPKSSALSAEGRFGSELRATRDLLVRATPKSLVILDELAEGTTAEERLEISKSILSGFKRLGCGLMLVTHNHKLAEFLKDHEGGCCIKVELINDEPTYRLVPGISTVSRADRVAKKVGLAPEDIEEILRAKNSHRRG